jgi:DNA polymerase III epsilon subunit-like protein
MKQSRLEQFKDKILELKQCGYGSRYIANLLGVGKSTVNDFLKKHNESAPIETRKPRILLLDIETSPTMAAVWRLWKENIGLEQINNDWFIMSYSAKWLKDSTVYYEDCRDTLDDIQLLINLHKLLSEADIVVCHNVKFDIPKIKARMVLNNILPPKPFKTYCTLEAAKKNFNFTSNKLAYLSDKLSSTPKLSHEKYPGFKLWAECLKGNQEAWDVMKEYNQVDVLALEDVYLKLKVWDDKHPNVDVYNDNIYSSCVSCNSPNVSEKDYSYTNTGLYKQYQCSDCGKWMRSRYTLNSTTKRKSLLKGE